MMIAVIILFGLGVMVEIGAVLFAPIGYQDANGFHVAPEGANDAARTPAENTRPTRP